MLPEVSFLLPPRMCPSLEAARVPLLGSPGASPAADKQCVLGLSPHRSATRSRRACGMPFGSRRFSALPSAHCDPPAAHKQCNKPAAPSNRSTTPMKRFTHHSRNEVCVAPDSRSSGSSPNPTRFAPDSVSCPPSMPGTMERQVSPQHWQTPWHAMGKDSGVPLPRISRCPGSIVGHPRLPRLQLGPPRTAIDASRATDPAIAAGFLDTESGGNESWRSPIVTATSSVCESSQRSRLSRR